MDDEPGIAMIEKARRLGVRNIAIHKGLSFGPQSYEHSTCLDIGRVAKRYPDVNFLVYHSGFVADAKEGPTTARTDGVDALVTSLLENGVAPGSNVYAELGSTWRLCMRDRTRRRTRSQAIRYCGESNVLWGTDSIWYGSPQDQIQAFRTFQIAPELRERHGYAEMTPALRAKIFGLNALRIYPVPGDVLQRTCATTGWRAARPSTGSNRIRRSSPRTETRREFLNLLAWTEADDVRPRRAWSALRVVLVPLC